MIFQIAGLPRSGTAWIASVLNLCPDVICVHEPVDRNVPIPQESYTNTGQAGSHLLLPKWANMESDLRIYINRAPADAYSSMVEVLGGMSWETYLRRIAAPAREYEEMADIVIDFDALFTEGTVMCLWEYISDLPFQRDKVASMLNMNIQRESLDYNFDKKFQEEVHKFHKEQEDK